jgi:hypothetical protein
LLVSVALHGQQQAAPGEPIPLMRQLFVQDQRDRGVALNEDGKGMLKGEAAKALREQLMGINVNQRDAARHKQVRELLATGDLKTAQDFRDASFIFQHSDQPDDYLLAHLLAVNAIALGDTSARWIAAATMDRYLQAIGQKQVFGTQFLSQKYLYYLGHKQDADIAEMMKAQANTMTQQPYNAELFPDALRQQFCVPTLAQQQEDLAAWSKGGVPAPHAIPGCGR